MPDQIYIGNFAKGLTTNRLPFNIDNDAFPTMYNFYSWRGRAKRKRGTSTLGQLARYVSVASGTPTSYQIPSFNLSGDTANLITACGLESSSTIVPKMINLVVGVTTYTDPLGNGVLSGGSGGTINYATGDIIITGGGTSAVSGTFAYYPGLPVMGLRDFISPSFTDEYPVLLAFDTKYSYQFNQSPSPVLFYNTNYYKTTQTQFEWSGQDFQLFFTTNYSSALWATNNKPGFHFVAGTYTSGSTTAEITFNFKSNTINYADLIVGDKLWFNEWPSPSTINTLIGTVSDVSDAVNGNYKVTFDTSVTVSGDGIAQLLTASISGQDGIKFYDGDPTSGTGIPTVNTVGWVNFAPPLTESQVSIDKKTQAKYYLVGSRMILPFQDRLLFFSPWIQSSSGAAIQLKDTILWSWNGTPYYNGLTPANQTSDPSAYYVDQTGKGGYLSAGIDEPITTANLNENVLIVGFGGNGRKTRFVYSGNDLQPFNFFSINAELPSNSTFSSISLDNGTLDFGTYGIAITDQQSAQRIDMTIPDYVFKVKNLNNGLDRINAARDFQKEWIYFAYPVNDSQWKYPTQTFMFNYRENNWAIFYENYTAHGNFRKQKKYTWRTLPFKTWNTWKEPWNSGTTTALIPQIVAGNPQGYVLIRAEGTGEAPSGTVKAISVSSGNAQITSNDHCLKINDYLYFTNFLGNTSLNGQIGKVISISNSSTFVVDIPLSDASGYLGKGQFTRLCQPLLQTKQFGMYWDQGRKTRLAVQKYLLDRTAASQITVNIYLSQNPDNAWNDSSIYPDPESSNDSLVYSQVVYTCPESTNLGLTPTNTNLQMPTASTQKQIWHRFNTSLQGDTVQLGFTLNDSQMRNLEDATAEITLHGIHLVVERGQHLA